MLELASAYDANGNTLTDGARGHPRQLLIFAWAARQETATRMTGEMGQAGRSSPGK